MTSEVCVRHQPSWIADCHGENVISYRGGGHRGWFVSGAFRDPNGQAVAFVRGEAGSRFPV
jgi:hypothetical protein